MKHLFTTLFLATALAAVGRKTLGLAGMRERGLMLGGKVIIFSHPGQGTTVQAFIPMHKDMY